MSQIIDGMENYMTKCGGTYSDWYCGITSDPDKRLFNDHNVSK